jgi:MmeI, DNA-methyltransferase domain/MmeI, target recognition domain/MmeI, N-terminal domain/MmeI, helicase spacer domain/MmeI, C-terminal domain
MNAVEIEEAISDLAAALFERDEFVFQFLHAFGNKETAIRRLRSNSNSDIAGAILQKNNIHLAVCDPGCTAETLEALRQHPKTARNKCKFILVTDGETLEAEDMSSGEHIACPLPELPDHFGFLLPLAGITAVEQIKNNPIDIRATRHLNKLYIALLQENPDWATPERRHDLNQFMARLIFCFFAEDTGIFFGENLFTKTLMQYSAPDSSNTHEVISELFRAMDMPTEARAQGEVKNWANQFPYVNGGLFAGTRDVPKFSKMARATLLAAGGLQWTHINPDIFGSMIQAVADEGEREALGMHYTSVPNIMKVLGPLFLDDLNAALEEAGDNPRKLLNLRKRLSRIRVFDPACGSGNFLVIAYIRMREIEQEIIRRRKDDPKSFIKLTQFYGIEIKSFPAEIARLALLIAEFQCNVRMIGQQEAILDILPLHQTGNIHCGNALRMDWLEVCPQSHPIPEMQEHSDSTRSLSRDSDQLNDWETYICGNPPYVGSSKQSAQQKSDIEAVFSNLTKKWRSLDYVACWFKKASDLVNVSASRFAYVCTNSICQGEQVPILWPIIYENGQDIRFARTSFKWSNLASKNAGVTVIAIGIDGFSARPKLLFETDALGETQARIVANISAYLVPSERVIVESRSSASDDRGSMIRGSMPTDGGNLLLTDDEKFLIETQTPQIAKLIKSYVGAVEFINGLSRYCLWITDEDLPIAQTSAEVSRRIDGVRQMRLSSTASSTRDYAKFSHRFRQIQGDPSKRSIVLPRITSENRQYLPVGVCESGTILSSQNFAIYDEPLWSMAIIASSLHLVWIGTVCGRTRTDFAYSNTLGWNTFPVPRLTATNRADLTRCAEDILLAREAHFPATIADLYDTEKMPDNLRAAHERNDTVLEEIYIGRRFRNDTERLEKLFDMYTKMTRKGAA